MNFKKVIKLADKIRTKYCIGKQCKNCHYKSETSCLNKVAVEMSCIVMDGEKKDKEEKERLENERKQAG